MITQIFIQDNYIFIRLLDANTNQFLDEKTYGCKFAVFMPDVRLVDNGTGALVPEIVGLTLSESVSGSQKFWSGGGGAGVR